MLGRDEMLILSILPMVLVLLVGRLFLRPGSFRKPTRWDFTRGGLQISSSSNIISTAFCVRYHCKLFSLLFLLG